MTSLQMNGYTIEFFNPLFEVINDKFHHITKQKDIFVVTDESVASLYQKELMQAATDFVLHFIVVPEGERSKSFETYQEVCEKLIDKGCKKYHCLVAFGGGVIGDLTGFVAATLYRGMAYVQIPTTLLAQVDSSIGAKTAINTKQGKNLVGAFYEPKAVWIDTYFLKTLERREYHNGVAEMIKAGLIGDSVLYRELKAMKTIDLEMIARSIAVKKAIVLEDPYEKDRRRVLNFGHTYGHVIEKIDNYHVYKHGEAVALGMLIALEIGIEEKVTPAALYQDVYDTLKQYELAKETLDKEAFEADIWLDKKVNEEGLIMILLSDIGQAKTVLWRKKA